MAKKPVPTSPSKPIPATTSPAPTPAVPSIPSKPVSSTISARSPQDIAVHVWNKYLNETPTRTMLLDVFMVFLVLVGGIQFLYCILAGNYPFNAFLSGFSAAVGQFVLTASLRMQTSESNSPSPPKKVTKTTGGSNGEVVENGGSKISSERAFADFVFGSLILHAFCINFIN